MANSCDNCGGAFGIHKESRYTEHGSVVLYLCCNCKHPDSYECDTEHEAVFKVEFRGTRVACQMLASLIKLRFEHIIEVEFPQQEITNFELASYE